MLHNINFYKIVLILFVLLSNHINAKEVYIGEKTVDIPECKQEHYTKDINTSKYIEYLYNKLDLSKFPSILGQQVKYTKDKYLKDYYKSTSVGTTIINKENKELELQDDGVFQVFTILNIENTILTVKEFDQAKQGSYMTESVLEIDMSDGSVTDLGLCYAR